MDDNLTERELPEIFRFGKALMVAIVIFLLSRNITYTELPSLQLAVALGMLSVFNYFSSILYVTILYLLLVLYIPPQFFTFIAQSIK